MMLYWGPPMRLGFMGSRDKVLLVLVPWQRAQETMLRPQLPGALMGCKRSAFEESPYWPNDWCVQGHRNERICEGLIAGLGKRLKCAITGSPTWCWACPLWSGTHCNRCQSTSPPSPSVLLMNLTAAHRLPSKRTPGSCHCWLSITPAAENNHEPLKWPQDLGGPPGVVSELTWFRVPLMIPSQAVALWTYNMAEALPPLLPSSCKTICGLPDHWHKTLLLKKEGP